MKLILRLIGLKMSILRVDAAIINPKTVKPNLYPRLQRFYKISFQTKKITIQVFILIIACIGYYFVSHFMIIIGFIANIVFIFPKDLLTASSYSVMRRSSAIR